MGCIAYEEGGTMKECVLFVFVLLFFSGTFIAFVDLFKDKPLESLAATAFSFVMLKVLEGIKL